MFSLFRKKEPKNEKPSAKRARYIYKPYENAMAFRVEFREDRAYVYPGWSKGLAYTVEGENICSAAGELLYIIIEKKIYDAAGEKLLYFIRGNEIYKAGKADAIYQIRDSITVQGTL